MTEAEWQVATDPTPMLEFLRGKASERKLRLFDVACCRRVWGLLSDNRSRFAVDELERRADLPDTPALEYETAASAESAADNLSAPASEPGQAAKWQAAESASGAAFGFFGSPAHTAAYAISLSKNGIWDVDPGECAVQVTLIRCIFGNPFRPVTLDPNWRTSTVHALARQMYESRDFAPMPILADALQDAGCDHPDVLDHCRGPGPHVRGCWVVDLILGKS